MAKLRSNSRKKYGDHYDQLLLSQWETCVEMAERVVEKRNNTNNIFITINSALIAISTVAFNYKNILISIIGIIVCMVWKSTIDSYTKLSTVKYGIVNEIEKSLPTSPFTYEWEKLKERDYTKLTRHEKKLPIIFVILYTISIVVSAFSVLPSIVDIICKFKGAIL